MQCEKLNIKIDRDKIYDIFSSYTKKIIKIAETYPGDVIRVMTNYPSGTEHYTMTKRKDENWDKIDTDEYILLTRMTKFGSRMISVYFKKNDVVHEYVEYIINKIRKNQNINKEKKAVVAIVYAGPKFRLEKHIDTNGLVRYHIPIVISNNSYFETFDPYQKYYPKTGEVWRLETHIPHAAQNDDDKNYRIHCIIDFL